MPAGNQYQDLTTAGIIGDFYNALETEFDKSWASKVGWMNDRSNQLTETYRWLGQSPVMRPWQAGRTVEPLRKEAFTITNQVYESTMAFSKFDLRQDKTGQIAVRINDQAARTTQHWEELLSTLILNGGASTCYDGEYFFDTDHPESGTSQKNLLTASEIPALNVGTATAPTVAESIDALMGILGWFYTMKDDRGQPANGNARSFLVMVGTAPLFGAVSGAVHQANLSGSVTNTLAAMTSKNGITLDVVLNPRIAAETDDLYVFRTDGNAKPFILQEENGVEVEVLGEGSDHAFKNGEHLFGVNANRAAGYGMWNQAIHATLS